MEIDTNGGNHANDESQHDEGGSRIKFVKLNKEIILVIKASLTMNLFTEVMFTIIVANRILDIIYQHYSCSAEWEAY